MTYIVRNTPSVAIVAYDGVQQSAVHGLGEIFDVASRYAAADSGAGISHCVVLPGKIDRSSRFDAVIFPPNLTGVRGAGDLALHEWIISQHEGGALLCSACAGSFWLAEAGVLDGRPATTHWALEAEFASRFPKVQLNPERTLLDDNDIVTAGGVMAWVDLGVHLVGRWLGPSAVSRLCRQMLIDPTGRDQRNFRSFRPEFTHKDQTIRSLQMWIEGNLGADLTVAALARQAGVSERSLHRKFPALTGLSVNRYVQELRVEKAKGLLELTADPVASVCWQVGYQDVPAFCRLFKSITGTSPGEYRSRFNIARRTAC